jgi:two-component system KDP operon response regulator KdpE
LSYSQGKLSIDFATRETRLDGKQVKLTPTEYKLLYYLVKNEGSIVSKETLSQNIWGSEYFGAKEELRKYIYRLRSKLNTASDIILTERGVGYRFISPQ